MKVIVGTSFHENGTVVHHGPFGTAVFYSSSVKSDRKWCLVDVNGSCSCWVEHEEAAVLFVATGSWSR